MMRYGRWIGLLVATLIGAQIAVRSANSGVISPASDFTQITLPSGSRQACWHGICPGQMTVEHAKELLNTINYLHPVEDPSGSKVYRCWRNDPPSMNICLLGTDIVDTVTMQFYRFGQGDLVVDNLMPVQLGDLVVNWGAPISFSAPYCWRSRLQFENGGGTEISWVPDENNLAGQTWALSPTTQQIESITLQTRAQSNSEQGLITWTGFIDPKIPIPCGV